jgi:hypothetical protein
MSEKLATYWGQSTDKDLGDTPGKIILAPSSLLWLRRHHLGDLATVQETIRHGWVLIQRGSDDMGLWLTNDNVKETHAYSRAEIGTSCSDEGHSTDSGSCRSVSPDYDTRNASIAIVKTFDHKRHDMAFSDSTSCKRSLTSSPVLLDSEGKITWIARSPGETETRCKQEPYSTTESGGKAEESDMVSLSSRVPARRVGMKSERDDQEHELSLSVMHPTSGPRLNILSLYNKQDVSPDHTR